MPGHSRNPVVQNDYRSRRLIIIHVDKTCNSGMEESRVSQYRYGILRRFRASRFFKPMGHCDGRAHTETGVHG